MQDDAQHEQRVFNLQIQIQKLEEELTLYRNGASGQELFEVIGEKNSEIADLRSNLASKSDSLKKLAKSSGDVLAQYSALQDSFEQLKVGKLATDQLIAAQNIDLEELGKKHAVVMKERDELEEDVTNKQDKLCTLERELIDANVIIEKLHKRGATLVAEKSEKSKSLDKTKYEKAEMEKKYQTEISKLNSAANGFKKQLEIEVQEKIQANQQYEESQQMIKGVRAAITAAQNTNETAKADMKKIQVSYEAKIVTLKEQIENMKTSSSESEENLIKMKHDCDKLSAALSQQAMRHSKELQAREDHWLNEHKRVLKLSETAQMRVGRLEGEKETTITSRRECDILRAKNLELEEKARRLEQQTKSRFLRDKTNTLPTSSIDDTVTVSGTKGVVTIIQPTVSASTTEHPIIQTAKAPIFPMHHRIPPANTNIGNNSRPNLGGSSKLHEPGCSINSHR